MKNNNMIDELEAIIDDLKNERDVLKAELLEMGRDLSEAKRSYDTLSLLYNQQIEAKVRLFDKLDAIADALEMTASHEQIVHAIENIMEEV